jgi:hypothetical protein
MSNPYDPYPGQQQPQADPAAPTQFMSLGGQPPQAPAQPGYGAPQPPQDASGAWGQQSGQAPYATPQPGPQEAPGAWGQQPQAPYGAAQPGQPYGVPQQPGVPGFGTGQPGPQAPYGYPTPVTEAKAKRGGGARIAAGIFGTVLGRVLVFAVIAGGIAIYHFATNNSAHRDSSGNVSQAGSLGIGDLKVGDCFNAPSSSSDISSVTAIPCTQAHDSQVYAEPKITESTYPDSTTLDKEAGSDCDSAAKSGINPSVPTDAQEAYYAAQDSSTFDQGFNYIVCAIQSPSKNLTQSYVTGS